MNKKILGKILSLFVIFGLIGLVGWQVFVFSGFERLVNLTNSAFDNTGFDFGVFFGGKVDIKGQKDGRTNILLFGINEFDGDGNGTVDSNILISYFHDQKKVSTISFMRDMLVDQGAKLNSVYPELVTEKNLQTSIANKSYLEFFGDILGLPVHYGVKINMKAAKELVDKIGGIEIEVKNTFKDNEYPKFNDYSNKLCPERGLIDPFMCPAPRFNKGLNKMDGDTALIYARSRKGVCFDSKTKTWYDTGCPENGDDARNNRQQEVIQGVAQKLKNDVESRKLIFDLSYLQGVFEALGSNIQTTMSLAEAYTLTNELKNSNLSDLKRISINYRSTEFKKDQLLLCDDNAGGVLFCDGSILSKSNNSNYALRLRQIIQNPLNEPEPILKEKKTI
ncbi:MAG: LCP family protein [Patescibacteria group bacterium]